MVFRYCLGMIMSVSTLMIFSGAATPSSVVNFSIDRTSWLELTKSVFLTRFIANAAGIKGQNAHFPQKWVPVLRIGYAPKKILICRRFDRRHVVIGETEMMADLVDQHMADDPSQRFVMFGPVIQDRAAIQPDHVGQPRNVVLAAKRQADALKQAEQVEFAFGLHLVEHFFGRKIIATDDPAFAQTAKALRQALENLVRHRLDLGQRGRFRRGPHPACLEHDPEKWDRKKVMGAGKESGGFRDHAAGIGGPAAVDVAAAIGDRTARHRLGRASRCGSEQRHYRWL